MRKMLIGAGAWCMQHLQKKTKGSNRILLVRLFVLSISWTIAIALLRPKRPLPISASYITQWIPRVHQSCSRLTLSLSLSLSPSVWADEWINKFFSILQSERQPKKKDWHFWRTFFSNSIFGDVLLMNCFVFLVAHSSKHFSWVTARISYGTVDWNEIAKKKLCTGYLVCLFVRARASKCVYHVHVSVCVSVCLWVAECICLVAKNREYYLPHSTIPNWMCVYIRHTIKCLYCLCAYLFIYFHECWARFIITLLLLLLLSLLFLFSLY